jgi:hypothetical protein
MNRKGRIYVTAILDHAKTSISSFFGDDSFFYLAKEKILFKKINPQRRRAWGSVL